MKDAILCMDIGGTNCRMGLCGRDYTLYEKEIVSTEEMAQSGFQRSLIGRIRAFLSAHQDGYRVLGISMGFPATIDKARRVVLQAPAIEGASGLCVCDVLEQEFRLPVFLEKDVNLLLAHDLKDLAVPTDGFVIGIYFGTGIGNSIYYNGRPVAGRNGVAGELGHIPQLFAGKECGCGNVGCLEPYGGGKRLSELCRTVYHDVDIKSIYRDCLLSDGIRDQVDAMAVAVATEANILDPEYIVLGGGVLQMEGFPLSYFENAVFNRVRKPYPAQNLRIVYARPDQENGIIGAGIYGWEQLESYNHFSQSAFCESFADGISCKE